MTKKHFIALADAVRVGFDINANRKAEYRDTGQVPPQIEALARFCRAQNPSFNYARWYGYIYGLNGPNGGAR